MVLLHRMHWLAASLAGLEFLEELLLSWIWLADILLGVGWEFWSSILDESQAQQSASIDNPSSSMRSSSPGDKPQGYSQTH